MFFGQSVCPDKEQLLFLRTRACVFPAPVKESCAFLAVLRLVPFSVLAGWRPVKEKGSPSGSKIKESCSMLGLSRVDAERCSLWGHPSDRDPGCDGLSGSRRKWYSRLPHVHGKTSHRRILKLKKRHFNRSE